MRRKLFDPRNIKHRIAGAGIAIASGVIYAAAAGADPPAAAVALMGTVGSLGTEFFAGGIQDELGAGLGTSEEVLRNHDLDRASGQAIAFIVQDFAATLDPGVERDAVTAFAGKIADRWVRLSLEGETPPELAEPQLSTLFAVGAGQAEERAVLDSLAWCWLLDRLAVDPGSGRLTDLVGGEARTQLGDLLHRRFARALREVLKADFARQGRAFPAMVLILLGDIRHAIDGLGGRAVEVGLDTRFAELLAKAQEEVRTALQAQQADIVAAVREAGADSLGLLSAEIRSLGARLSTREEDRQRHTELRELLRALQPQVAPAAERAEVVRSYAAHLLRESRHRTLSTGGLLAGAARVEAQIREPELFDTFVEPMLTQRATAGDLQREVEQLVRTTRDPDAEPHLRAEAEVQLLKLRGHELEKLWSSDCARTASEVLAKEPALAILGDPGAGKSTLLRWMLLHRAQEIAQGHSGPIPLFVTLPNYAESWASAAARSGDLPLLGYLTEYLEKQYPGLGAAVAAELLPGGCGVLLLLDGLDEVALERRRAVSDHIHEFVAKYVGAERPSRLYLTSRFFGYDQAPVGAPVVHVVLAPLNDAQVREFTGKWYWWLERLHHPHSPSRERAEQHGRRLGEVLLSHHQLTDLVRNPLLLTMVAAAVRQGNVLPRRRVEFYELALKQLMTQWAHMRSDALKRPVPIDYGQACLLWAPIARWMHEQALPAVPEHELLAKLEERLDELESDDSAADWLSIKGDQCCLVQQRGDRLFGFLHQTFREYLAGRDLNQNGAFLPELDRYIADPYWHEVLRLAAGYLGVVAPSADKKPVTELLRRILHRGSDFEPLLHRDLFLAARCLSDEVNPRRASAEEIVERLLNVAASPTVPEVRIQALDLLYENAGVAVALDRWREPVTALSEAASWEIRVGLARWLGAMEGTARLPYLELLSADRDSDVAGTARAALVASSPSRVSLERYFESSASMMQIYRIPADARLQDEGIRLPVQAAAVSLLGSADARVRLRAAEWLRETERGAETEAALVGLLGSTDEWVRRRAAELLRRTERGAETEAALVGLLGSESERVRLEAAEVLRETERGAEAEGALAGLLGSENEWVRRRAAELLRETERRAEAEAALVGLLGSENAGVRLQAARLLRGTERRAEAEGALVGLLGSAEAGVRQRAAELLRETERGAEAEAALVGLLGSAEAGVRQRAARLLRGTERRAEAEAALVGLLASENAGVRQRAAEVLRETERGAEAEAALVGLLGSADAGVRLQVAELLQQTEPGEPTQHLLVALQAQLQANDAWPPDTAVAGHPQHSVAWLYATLAVREGAGRDRGTEA